MKIKKKNTYFINSKYLSKDFLKNLKINNKNIKGNRIIGFNLHNLLNKKNIYYKMNKKFFMKTSTNINDFDNNEWIIIRNINGLKQKNIIINQKKNIKNFIESKNLIITKLILDPDLINGYKYHFRVNYLLRNNKEIYVDKFYRILTCKEKFDINNINEKNILSGLNSNQLISKFYLKDDLDEQIKEIGKEILNFIRLENKSKLDWFQILGADLILNNKKELKIIEINNRYVGYALEINEDKEKLNDLSENIKNVLFYNKPLNKNLILINE
jgi:hypothetical protein